MTDLAFGNKLVIKSELGLNSILGRDGNFRKYNRFSFFLFNPPDVVAELLARDKARLVCCNKLIV